MLSLVFFVLKTYVSEGVPSIKSSSSSLWSKFSSLYVLSLPPHYFYFSGIWFQWYGNLLPEVQKHLWFFSFHVVLCHVRLAYLSCLSLFCWSLHFTLSFLGNACSPHAFSLLHVLMGLVFYSCTSCVLMNNHVRYLEFFPDHGLGRLPSTLSPQCTRNSHFCLWMITWTIDFKFLFLVLNLVPNSSSPHYHAHHHTEVRIYF